MQIGPVHVEPDLGAIELGIKTLHQPPEAQRVIELDEMADLVRGEIVEDERGREDEPPGKRQYACVRARAPTARLIAYVDAFDRDAELGRVTPACGFEIALRLALEKIADAAVDVRRLARDAEQALSAVIGLDPNRTAAARRLTMRCGSPRSGSSRPWVKGAASGNRLSRAAIQPPCFCAKSLASFTLPRGGMVRTTSREAASMRSV